jgi:hypothetical protein
LKIAIVILNKRRKTISFHNGQAIDTALMGASLIFKAATEISEVKSISLENAIDIILEAILNTDKSKI